MQGFVLSFRPNRGDGALLTESGELYRFEGTSKETPFQGGDLVSFETDGNPGSRTAYQVQLIEKCRERLTQNGRPLLAELRETVAIDGLG